MASESLYPYWSEFKRFETRSHHVVAAFEQSAGTRGVSDPHWRFVGGRMEANDELAAPRPIVRVSYSNPVRMKFCSKCAAGSPRAEECFERRSHRDLQQDRNYMNGRARYVP